MNLIHDGEIDVATAKKFSDPYISVHTTWQKFVNTIEKSVETSETHAEYLKMDKDQQNMIKNVGGFVGGMLSGTQRVKTAVVHRSLLTLDIDSGVPDQFEDFKLIYDCAAVLYSTHSHSLQSPSYRLIIPLLRPVDGDEFEAISRKIVETLGPKHFCGTSFIRHQIMYWPSHSKDVTPVFELQDAEWLDPDKILGQYGDWKNMAEWNVDKVTIGKKQEDPLEKKGQVGVFCRTYDIHEAIDKFIPDYKRSDFDKNIYTYIKGSTSNGVKTYDDKFSYSHHSSDPVSEVLCNAFDLVRLMLYSEADIGFKGTKYPSYKKMIELMDHDPRCKSRMIREKHDGAVQEFSSVAINDTGEIVSIIKTISPSDSDIETLGKKLEIVQGVIQQTRANIIAIFETDCNLKQMIRYDEFTHIDVVTSLPWRVVSKSSNTFTDLDHSCLRQYFETWYKIDNAQKVQDGFNEILNRNHFHPIREYLGALKWDGVERVDSLMIDYLGADDSKYTRVATRKMLLAAVARVFEPGIKFDTMMVFVGPQGKGKSWLIGKLGGEWFSETLGNIHTKEAMESLQGVWLLEVGELSQFRKVDIETVKGFISRRVDRFRPSYGRATVNYHRQCIFFGTTNEIDFLIDQTGNRRFWPIDVSHGKPSKSIAEDLGKYEIDQIWAEVMETYIFGTEELIISEELQQEVLEAQEEFTQQDDRTAIIHDFLNLKLPANWDEMTVWDRRGYIDGDGLYEIGTVERHEVSVHEIWIELMKKDKADMTNGNTKYIHNIMRKMSGWKQVKGKKRIHPYGSIRIYEKLKINANH